MTDLLSENEDNISSKVVLAGNKGVLVNPMFWLIKRDDMEYIIYTVVRNHEPDVHRMMWTDHRTEGFMRKEEESKMLNIIQFI